METPYDYRKFAILYVDDEERSLKCFQRAFQDQFRILTAPNAAEGLRQLEAQPDGIGVLMTDQRMPGQKGVWLLEKTRQLRPRILRLLVTAYSDMESAIAAVNTGAIYKYISKPWDPAELETTLKHALEFFLVQLERDQLLEERLAVLQNLMTTDRLVSVGLLASGLSHHIRNSLVAVKTFLDLAPLKLQEEKLDPASLRNTEFWKDYHLKAQAQLEKINQMLRDLWTASDHPAPELRDEIHLRPLLAEVLEQLQPNLAANQLCVRNQIPDTLPPLRVEKARFSRLFELLLKDELVSLPPGSEITLQAEHLPGLHPPGSGEMLVRLHDNGPGLPEETLRLVFDPFALRSDTPLEYGLNLMACYFIVHHHGGRIEARSEPGQGTTFTMRLPLDPNRAILTRESDYFLERVLLNRTTLDRLLGAA